MDNSGYLQDVNHAQQLYKTPTQQRLMPSTVWRMHSIECGIKAFSVSSHSWTGNMTLGLFHIIQASLVIRDLTLRVFAITRFREKKP